MLQTDPLNRADVMWTHERKEVDRVLRVETAAVFMAVGSGDVSRL
jgi:hypothetical protein